MRFSTPISARTVWPSLFLMGAVVAESSLAEDSAPAPPVGESARQPVLYAGDIQPDKRLHDGGLRHAVGDTDRHTSAEAATRLIAEF